MYNLVLGTYSMNTILYFHRPDWMHWKTVQKEVLTRVW